MADQSSPVTARPVAQVGTVNVESTFTELSTQLDTLGRSLGSVPHNVDAIKAAYQAAKATIDKVQGEIAKRKLPSENSSISQLEQKYKPLFDKFETFKTRINTIDPSILIASAVTPPPTEPPPAPSPAAPTGPKVEGELTRHQAMDITAERKGKPPYSDKDYVLDESTEIITVKLSGVPAGRHLQVTLKDATGTAIGEPTNSMVALDNGASHVRIRVPKGAQVASVDFGLIQSLTLENGAYVATIKEGTNQTAAVSNPALVASPTGIGGDVALGKLSLPRQGKTINVSLSEGVGRKFAGQVTLPSGADVNQYRLTVFDIRAPERGVPVPQGTFELQADGKFVLSLNAAQINTLFPKAGQYALQVRAGSTLNPSFVQEAVIDLKFSDQTAADTLDSPPSSTAEILDIDAAVGTESGEVLPAEGTVEEIPLDIPSVDSEEETPQEDIDPYSTSEPLQSRLDPKTKRKPDKPNGGRPVNIVA